MRTEPAWTSYPFQTALSWIATLVIAALVVLAAECSPMPAHAGQFYLEGGAGIALMQRTIEDGTWWQRDLAHKFQLEDFAAKVGLGYRFNDKWSVQAYAMSWGTAKVESDFVLDHHYNPKNHKCMDAVACANPMHIKVADAMRGFEASVTRTFEEAYGVSPYVRLGMALMIHNLSVTVDNSDYFDHRGGRIPMTLLGGGACYGHACLDLTYYKGLGGMDCLNGCGFPIAKDALVSLFTVKIPLGS